MLDPKDGGMMSRKLHLSYAVMVLLTLGFLATGKWPALAATYAQYTMSLLGASTLYMGGNSVHKWLVLKQSMSNPNAPIPPDEPDEDPKEASK